MWNYLIIKEAKNNCIHLFTICFPVCELPVHIFYTLFYWVACLFKFIFKSSWFYPWFLVTTKSVSNRKEHSYSAHCCQISFKGYLLKPIISNIIFMNMIKAFFLKSEIRWELLLSWLLFNIALKVLHSSLRQDKEIKDIRCWSESKKKVTNHRLYNCLIKDKIIHRKVSRNGKRIYKLHVYV